MSSTIVISESDIHEIAKILMESADLVQSKQRFYNSLGLPNAEFYDIQTRVLFSGSYDFFNLTLTKWIQLKKNEATLEVLIEKLREGNFNLTASKLTTWTPDPTPSTSFSTLSTGVFGTELPSKGWLSVPVILPSIDFDKIYPRTQDGQLSTDTVQQSLEKYSTICIHGPNGYGKSTIAIFYAFLNYRKYSYMIWLEAKTLSKLETNIKDVAHKLGIPSAIRLNPHSEQMTPKSLGQIFDEIYSKLKGKKCLIVFDNVEMAQEIQHYLPGVQYRNDFHVLLTSRRPIEFLRNFKIDVFVPEEAVSYLCKELGVTSEHLYELELVKIYAKRVQYVPVALELVISSNVSDISSQLEAYLCNKDSVDMPIAQLRKDMPEYPAAVFTSFEVFLNVAKRDLLKRFSAEKVEITIWLLHIMAFLDPDDIPLEIFDYGYIPNIPIAFDCLRILLDHNIFVKVKTSDSDCYDIIRISTVWQTILQIRFQKLEKGEKVKILKLAITIGERAPNRRYYELREQLWEFAAVKAGTLFKSFSLIKLCWMNQYFNSEFCKTKISSTSFVKLFFFRLILDWDSCLFIMIFVVIVSVLNFFIQSLYLPIEWSFAFSYTLITSSLIILAFILSFFIESILCLLKPEVFADLSCGHIFVEIFVYIAVWMSWLLVTLPNICKHDRSVKEIEWNRDVMKIIFLALVGLVIFMAALYSEIRRLTNDWRRWFCRILLTFGTLYIVNLFIFTIWITDCDELTELVFLILIIVYVIICAVCILVANLIGCGPVGKKPRDS